MNLQALGVEFHHGGPRADEGVHAGLGEGRLVQLVVSVATIAHQIDPEVLRAAIENTSLRLRGRTRLKRWRNSTARRATAVACSGESAFTWTAGQLALTSMS